jgi:hypothetical protein
MKSKSISISGKFDADGKLMISNKAEFQAFGKDWKNHMIILVGTVYAEGSTGSQIGYYYNKIVPDFQRAYKEQGEMYTFKQVDEKLREMYPGCHIEITAEVGGFNMVGLKPINDLSLLEAIEFLEYIRMVGASEFDIVIEDPIRL